MAVRRAKLTGTVNWSDGSAFNGLCVVVLNPPTDGSGAAWPTICLGDSTYPRIRVPVRFPIPIVNGQFNQTASLPYTADLTPPTTRYSANYYDVSGNLIGGPSAVFQVTADPVTPVIPVLTVPTAPAAQTTLLES